MRLGPSPCRARLLIGRRIAGRERLAGGFVDAIVAFTVLLTVAAPVRGFASCLLPALDFGSINRLSRWLLLLVLVVLVATCVAVLVRSLVSHVDPPDRQNERSGSMPARKANGAADKKGRRAVWPLGRQSSTAGDSILAEYLLDLVEWNGVDCVSISRRRRGHEHRVVDRFFGRLDRRLEQTGHRLVRKLLRL